MTGKPLSLVAALLLCNPAAASAGGTDDESGLQRLMKELAVVEKVDARFREVKEVEVLQQPVTTRGHLRYRAPGFLKKQTLEPRRESVAIRGDRVVLEQSGGERREFSVDEHPAVRALVISMRATLAGDLETLQEYYDTDFQYRTTGWRLELTPRGDATADRVHSIVIRGQDARLSNIEIRSVGGARSTMTITPAER